MHNRKMERAQLKRKLEAGASVHMPAPRRIGKTWTVNRLAAELREAGWQAIELDVEGMRTTEEFVRDLCRRIEAQSSGKDRFKVHALQRINSVLNTGWGERVLDALAQINPEDFAETLIAALDASGDKVAILVDEVAYFYLHLAESSREDAESFAYKMRGLQQRYKNVRWLLTGSIGLDTIARRYGLEGAFVDFETFVLEPFTPDEARSFMRDPAVRAQFTHIFDASDEDFDAMFSELGWLAPYYLRLIANEVRPSILRGGEGELPTATKSDFETALSRLLQPNRRSEFAIWREHITKNLPASDRAIATGILDALSKTAGGESEVALVARATERQGSITTRQVRDILAMLFSDGLITKTEVCYRFRSGLVRRYWLEYEAE